MKRNTLILAVILFIIFALPVFAQVVEYVDIEQTQNEIDEKKTENQDLIKTVNNLRSDNERLSKAINRETKWVYRIGDVISSMETLIKALKYTAENTNNEDYKTKVQGMIDENESKLNTLQDRREKLNESIKDKKAKIEENNKQIRSTNETIAKNENRILYLEVAKNRTLQLEDKLTAYSKSIDKLIEILDAEIGEIEESDKLKEDKTEEEGIQ